MILNDAGKMIGRWWNELKNKYANIEIDEYVVMPNHCHGIINIVGPAIGADQRVGIVGADLCVCPGEKGERGEHVGSPQQGSPQDGSPVQESDERGRPIYTMIQWFKTMTTNDYLRNVKMNHWQPVKGRLWQRNYYEHIIRNETSLQNIREYIVNNPRQWQQDDLFL